MSTVTTGSHIIPPDHKTTSNHDVNVSTSDHFISATRDESTLNVRELKEQIIKLETENIALAAERDSALAEAHGLEIEMAYKATSLSLIRDKSMAYRREIKLLKAKIAEYEMKEGQHKNNAAPENATNNNNNINTSPPPLVPQPNPMLRSLRLRAAKRQSLSAHSPIMHHEEFNKENVPVRNLSDEFFGAYVNDSCNSQVSNPMVSNVVKVLDDLIAICDRSLKRAS